MSKIGIIGGSGLYDMEDLKNKKWIKITTPFGEPSDEYLTGKLQNKEVVFLPRHGRGHRILPSELNYRANIYGMKKLGVDRIISVSACGSLKEHLKPLDLVIPNQFVDRTNQKRLMTFFGEGIVAHIGFANPVCEDLSRLLYEVAKRLKISAHYGGTYINMEGPAFSTKAESNLYRSWEMDIIGMTNMPEAKLAREAEICYATLAFVTDYDCWHQTEEVVTIDTVIENLQKSVNNAKQILLKAMSKISEKRTCPCKDALKDAVITPLSMVPNKTKKKLELLLKKYEKK